MSAHFNIPEGISEKFEGYMTALRSFGQIPTGLGDGLGSRPDELQQLRETFHNFKISDKADFSESVEDGCRKDSLSTTFTGETSGSEPESLPSEALLGEALANAMLAANGGGPTPRRRSRSGSYVPVHVEDNFRDDASEAASLGDELPALSEMSPAAMAKRLFNNDNRILAHNEIAEYLGKR